MNDPHMPEIQGRLVYTCIGCGKRYDIYDFVYTCPECRSLLKIENTEFDRLKRVPAQHWREIFDSRRNTNLPELSGVFRFHELILPIVPGGDVIYLGEGQTPMVRANAEMSAWVGVPFLVKNDGLNPSASFKDRGMASAISFLNHVIRVRNLDSVLGICASTGDTSAAAALYLSYLPKDKVQAVVLLPAGKVTPQQLSQPLGSGAVVIEMPGVFDDCMRVVEELAQNYHVVLLNSKNPVRILGQKSYAYEIAQQLDWDTEDLTVVVPIGNAGNITAVMEGFADLCELGIIPALPTILGVQSHHADPIARWRASGTYAPLKVSPSVAQAAMIGDPVSFPKVRKLVKEHFADRFHVVSVTETEIMEGMLRANRNGHVVCTQGGESVAGLKKALCDGILPASGRFILDSTSHQLKFSVFQQMYFEDTFAPEYGIRIDDSLKNRPVSLQADTLEIARHLGLKKKG
ncbi:MAG: threonine synthase [Deltaproteobacteria bacterium]|jgi:threonine synthase|nr:threonine synthase [Deltaproteobacteria bacterium]MDX9761156.1 threonine synthase [Desulfomonilia bacterium]HPX18534.1 threonine synthase [Deltaproteobacteria bacterium]